MAAVEKTRIGCRWFSCHCGCKGSDSWHKPHIRRVVTDIHEDPGTYRVGVDGHRVDPLTCRRAGLARLPFSETPLVVREWVETLPDGRVRCFGWWVDTASVVAARQ